MSSPETPALSLGTAVNSIVTSFVTTPDDPVLSVHDTVVHADKDHTNTPDDVGSAGHHGPNRPGDAQPVGNTGHHSPGEWGSAAPGSSSGTSSGRPVGNTGTNPGNWAGVNGGHTTITGNTGAGGHPDLGGHIPPKHDQGI